MMDRFEFAVACLVIVVVSLAFVGAYGENQKLEREVQDNKDYIEFLEAESSALKDTVWNLRIQLEREVNGDGSSISQ